MNFEVMVGQSERHTVRYVFDRTWGRVTISVDGQPVQRRLHIFSLTPVRTYRLTVGELERHDVLIDKRRKMVVAGARAQACTVYVDGQLVGQYEG